MPFWNKIKNWLSGSKTPENGAKTVSPLTTGRPPTKPSPDEIHNTFKKDFFSILFRNKDKHITTMLNSISLSSDMKTLYIIDNGRAIAYDLAAPEGVLVGLLGKQLVAATASAPPPPIEVEDLPEDDGRRSAKTEKFTFKAGKNSQFTLTYNEGSQTLAIFGVEDIVINIASPDSGDCSKKTFSLEKIKVIRIKYFNELLIISSQII